MKNKNRKLNRSDLHLRSIGNLKRKLLLLLVLMTGWANAWGAPPDTYHYWMEKSDGTDGSDYSTLAEAVTAINSAAYACNLYIGEDCTLNEALTFTNTRNYAVTIFGDGHTITRGSGATGDLIIYDRGTTRTLTIYDLTLDGNNVSATGSLLKLGRSVQLCLKNFTAQNHTASVAGVCAVDASAAGAADYVQIYTAQISGNTAAGVPANLKIPATANYTCFYASLSDDLGINTTNNYALDAIFAKWEDANNTGWEHLKNDVLEGNGSTYQVIYSASGNVRWVVKDVKYYVEQTTGANGASFETLKEAVASINERTYACNLYRGLLKIDKTLSLKQ